MGAIIVGALGWVGSVAMDALWRGVQRFRLAGVCAWVTPDAWPHYHTDSQLHDPIPPALPPCSALRTGRWWPITSVDSPTRLPFLLTVDVWGRLVRNSQALAVGRERPGVHCEAVDMLRGGIARGLHAHPMCAVALSTSVGLVRSQLIDKAGPEQQGIVGTFPRRVSSVETERVASLMGLDSAGLRSAAKLVCRKPLQGTLRLRLLAHSW